MKRAPVPSGIEITIDVLKGRGSAGDVMSGSRDNTKKRVKLSSLSCTSASLNPHTARKDHKMSRS